MKLLGSRAAEVARKCTWGRDSRIPRGSTDLSKGKAAPTAQPAARVIYGGIDSGSASLGPHTTWTVRAGMAECSVREGELDATRKLFCISFFGKGSQDDSRNGRDLEVHGCKISLWFPVHLK